MSEAIRRRSRPWLQGLLCGAVLTLAPAAAILFAILLAPGLAASALERDERKPMSRSMLLLGLATAFGPARALWDGGYSTEACITLLRNPDHLLTAWLAACVGWLMEQGAQLAAAQISSAAAKRKIAALQKERAALVVEWGPLGPPPPRAAAYR